MSAAPLTADWTSHYISANGILHHYLEWGQPSNPPLLMLHATGLCARPWKLSAREMGYPNDVIQAICAWFGD